MLDFRQEMKALIEACLAGDIAVASLKVRGSGPHDLIATISPGTPPKVIGGVTYGAMPFTRELLVDLVVRAQRRRWMRFDDFTLELVPPDHGEWRDIASRIGPAPEHGPGWHDLVHAGIDMIIESGGDPKTSQIKEKYGSLRWYTAGREGDVGNAVVEAAEHVSYHLCDTCGAIGKRGSNRGWIQTRCEEHEHA